MPTAPELTHPTVSVLIVNFNSGQFVRRAVEMLARQTFRDFEVIVIDNGSTDDSANGLERKAPPVFVIRSSRNLGFAAGNNRAAQQARGRWLALLNPDAFPEPGWLAALVGASEKHPAFAMFGSKLVLDGDRGRLDGVGDVYHVSGMYWREGQGQPLSSFIDEPREIFAPCAAAALYRRDAFRAAGGFDEDFFCYGEDIDLGFRLRLAGHRALYVPDAVVHHVHSGTTGRYSDFSVYHGHRNLVWTYVKNMPGILFWTYLPFHLILNAASVVALARRGQATVVMRAKWDALRGLPRMLAKRAAIQRERRVTVRSLLRLMARGWPDRARAVSVPL